MCIRDRDYTAKEFLEYAGANATWSGLLTAGGIRRVDVPNADHTFSSLAQRSSVENATLDWLRKLES